MSAVSLSFKRRALILLLASAAALALAACGGSSGDGSTSASSPSSGTSGRPEMVTGPTPTSKTMYFINCFDANPWCKAWSTTFIQKMGEGGVEVTRLSNPFDPVKEAQQFEQAISQKPGAIGMFAADGQAIVPSVKKAEAAGIPVLNFTANIAPDGEESVTLNIVSNAQELGEKAANLMVSRFKQQGLKEANILYLTGVASQAVVVEQIEGFKRELEKTPQFKVVEEQDTQWDQTKAEELATQVFSKWQDRGGIQGVVGSNDPNVAGGIQAAEKLGLEIEGTKGIVFVGATCFPVGYENIQKGAQYGTVTESPTEEAEATSALVLKFFNGEPVPKNTELAEKTVTKQNLGTTGQVCNF